MKPLNNKQLRFIGLHQQTVLAKKPNVAQSCIDAGYKCSPESAAAAASRLLTDVSVQQLINTGDLSRAVGSVGSPSTRSMGVAYLEDLMPEEP